MQLQAEKDAERKAKLAAAAAKAEERAQERKANKGRHPKKDLSDRYRFDKDRWKAFRDAKTLTGNVWQGWKKVGPEAAVRKHEHVQPARAGAKQDNTSLLHRLDGTVWYNTFV